MDSLTTKKLIRLRIDKHDAFRSPAVRNITLWQQIGKEIGVTASKAEERWKYVLRRYRAAVDRMGSKGTEGSPLKFEFFDEMNEYFRGRPNIVPSDDNPNSMKSNLDSDDDIPIEDA